MVSCTQIVVSIVLIELFLFIFGGLLISFSYPATHDYVSTPHPKSPHSPPQAYNITQDTLRSYNSQGTVILRDILPRDILSLLQTGVNDIATNDTLHCRMAYFNGPPILHRCEKYISYD